MTCRFRILVSTVCVNGNRSCYTRWRM